jgi:negative regulator of sigma E activity
MTCEDYLHDPELNAAHLASCAACRAIADELDAPIDMAIDVQPRALSLDALPLAGWESASHRTWPLVAAGVAAVVILAVVLFLAAGTSPLTGMASALTSGVTSFEALSNFFRLFGRGLHGAPPAVHVTVAVLFVVINTILFLLLRRAPKGLDV